jgi:hypothetical protein
MPHPQPINSVSTVMAKKRSAPPTSYEAFFHGLGHEDLFLPLRLSARSVIRQRTLTCRCKHRADPALHLVSG